LVVSSISGTVGIFVQLRANLTSLIGDPVGGTNVFFYVNGAYVGNNVTNAGGIAIFNHLVQDGDSVYFASYAGNSSYNGIQSIAATLSVNKITFI